MLYSPETMAEKCYMNYPRSNGYLAALDPGSGTAKCLLLHFIGSCRFNIIIKGTCGPGRQSNND